MRALLASCALIATLAGPLSAQTARFIKVDIIGKSAIAHHHKGEKNENGPTEIHMRMPIALAKGILDLANEGDFKINGKTRKEIKVEQLAKLLEASKPGDMLLEITTDKGDLVKIVVE
jgi:hypothetical protein